LRAETKLDFLASRQTGIAQIYFLQPYLFRTIVNQQQIKLGITWGIVGILLLGYTLPVRATPPKSQTAPKLTAQGQKLPETAQIVVKGQTILLEVAKTSEEQSIGLMNRTNLAKDRGMLFVFAKPSPVRFWMKNTLIPLDMIFMSNGVVKHISAATPPCKADPCPSYGSDQKIDIDRVIELRSGRAAQLNLKVGDRVKIQDLQLNSVKKDRSN
jgi:uncharacterized protein